MADARDEGLRDNGYTTDVAADGAEALSFVDTTPYDAVVLDIQLPDIDGLAVCRTLRAGGSLTPILLLTARDTTTDKVAGLDSGADDYLTKPFVFDELLARLRALLRRSSPSRDPCLRAWPSAAAGPFRSRSANLASLKRSCGGPGGSFRVTPSSKACGASSSRTPQT